MTNELEKQFFDTFGIEPKQFIKDFPTREKAAAFGRKITGIPKYNKDKFEIGSYTNNIDIFQVHWKEYPQITDTHYLKLICIMSKELLMIVNLLQEDIEDVKSEILEKCISNYYRHREAFANAHREYAENMKHQVRTLFEEG